MTLAASKGVAASSLSLATTGTGAAVAIPSTFDNSFFVITGAGTISGGTVILEEADSDTYAGTWSQLTSITASTLTGGAQQVFHVFGNMRVVRARISSNIIGGGTISVDVYGAQ